MKIKVEINIIYFVRSTKTSYLLFWFIYKLISINESAIWTSKSIQFINWTGKLSIIIVSKWDDFFNRLIFNPIKCFKW